MARTTTPQVVRSYLAQLDKALVGVPAEVRDEIVSGVREELDGLDATDAAVRIETLGDPEFIAAEARAEAGEAPNGRTLQVETRSWEPRWFPVVAALLIAFGGIVIPVIGWVVGLALMWLSKTWRLRDKWVATLTPFVAVGLFVLVFALASVVPQPNSPAVENNPLVPGLFSAVWSSAVMVIPVNAVVGIWLLWRAKSPWSSDGPPQTARQEVAVPRRPQAAWYAPVTVLLIIGGGYVIPVVGWVAGVTMLWAADAWSIREKWLGTLAGPTAIVVAGLAVVAVRMGGGEWAGLVWWHLVLLGGVALPLVANVLVGSRLLRQAR